jgi:hypothetical protein
VQEICNPSNMRFATSDTLMLQYSRTRKISRF